MTKTKDDVHTTIYASNHDQTRRITVDEYDEGVWVCINVPGGSASIILTHEEAQKVIEGIQKVMSA